MATAKKTVPTKGKFARSTKEKAVARKKAKPIPELRAVTKSGHKVDYKKGTPVKFTVPRSGAVGKGTVDHVVQTKTGPFIHINYGDAASGKVLIPIRPSMVTPITAVEAKPKRVRPVGRGRATTKPAAVEAKPKRVRPVGRGRATTKPAVEEAAPAAAEV